MIAQTQRHVRLDERNKQLRVRMFQSCLALAAVLFTSIGQSGCSGAVSASHSGAANLVSGLYASTSSLSFGDVNLGAANTLAVTFTNTSNSSVTVSNVTIAGPGFSITGISNGMSVPPGASVPITVSFAPASPGHALGSITVTYSGNNPPITISLSGTGVSGHKAVLSWSPSSSPNVAGYYMYRSNSTGGPFSRLNGATPNLATTGIDTSVQSGQTYFYVVTAVDVNGFESAFSNEASAAIP